MVPFRRQVGSSTRNSHATLTGCSGNFSRVKTLRQVGLSAYAQPNAIAATRMVSHLYRTDFLLLTSENPVPNFVAHHVPGLNVNNEQLAKWLIIHPAHVAPRKGKGRKSPTSLEIGPSPSLLRGKQCTYAVLWRGTTNSRAAKVKHAIEACSNLHSYFWSS